MQGPLVEQTDEQLMKLYQNGDEDAFKALYGRHSSKIYGFIKKRIGNKEKVAEIFQDVFVKIHKSKSLYKESFLVLPWLFTVTKSVMLDELRKEKNLEVLDAGAIERAVGQNIAEPSTDTVAMLNQLPDIQKQAVEMRYVNDQTFEQIAETLNIKPTNVRKIVSRGIKRLRELVGEGSGS